MAMKECEHEEGKASLDYWQCSKCGWIKPGGEHRWNNTRGFFPSMEAVKQYDIYRTYPWMDEVRPMVSDD